VTKNPKHINISYMQVKLFSELGLKPAPADWEPRSKKEILAVVLNLAGVEDISDRSRASDKVWRRYWAAHLLAKRGWSHPQIGAALGLNQSVISYGKRRIKQMLKVINEQETKSLSPVGTTCRRLVCGAFVGNETSRCG
jgi:hypothetical protein